MQLKAVIKNMVKNIYQLNWFYKILCLSHFILKREFLIAAIVGLDTRATMNMDATIKGFPVNEDTVRDMLRNMPDTPK